MFAITGKGLVPIGNETIYLAPGQRYYLGASSSPEMVIVSRVERGGRFPAVYYYGYPYRREQRCELPMFTHLAREGCETWLNSGYSRMGWGVKMAESIRAVLDNQPGEEVDYCGYQRVLVEVSAPAGIKDPWHYWERDMAMPDVSYASNDNRTLFVSTTRCDAATFPGLLAGTGFAVVGVKED